MADTDGPVIVNHSHVIGMLGGGGFESAEDGDGGLRLEDQALLSSAFGALEQAEVDADVLSAPDDQAASLLQSFLADRALAAGNVSAAQPGGLEAKFDSHDVRWLRLAANFIRSKLGVPNRDPRPPLSETIYEMPNSCRMAILGDWGTGLYGAPPAAESIARDGGYDALVHLGDVYYSGAQTEIQRRFLSVWDVMTEANPRAVSRACNSNHEMYSGGGPYYAGTVKAFGQGSSTFVLQNDAWFVIGLDSAFHDHDLDPEQVTWLHTMLEKAGTRRVILLSHHQPFSRLSGQGPNLVAKLSTLLESQRVFAWYWGHEHLFAKYEPHAEWAMNGRCVGHSGFPYFRDDKVRRAPRETLGGELSFAKLVETPTSPAANVLDGPNEYVGDQRDRYGPNGYMRLEFQSARLHEALVAPNGTVTWEDDLT